RGRRYRGQHLHALHDPRCRRGAEGRPAGAETGRTLPLLRARAVTRSPPAPVAAMVGAPDPIPVRGLPRDTRHPVADRDERLPPRGSADGISLPLPEILDVLLLGRRRARCELTFEALRLRRALLVVECPSFTASCR